MIYHLLPEVEAFSEHAGGALSRWTGNVLRNDSARVLCPRADASWGFSSDRVITLPGMRLYGEVLRRREFRVRIAYRVVVLRWLMKGITRWLRDGDILYIHNRPEYVLALPRSGDRSYNVVLHMHNDHLASLTADQSALLDPDLAVFNSAFLEAQGRGLAAGLRNTSVLYNGADEECFYPSGAAGSGKPPVILFVGRLIPEKGVHVLIAAMRVLRAAGIEATARIVGSVHFGDSRSSDYVEALRASAPDEVQFIPYCAGKALADEFRKASIFCCPSVWDEPFGMVNVEAMASGLPVVATHSGGIPEIFSEGGALLVERNSSEALAGALKRLVLDPALRGRLAREGLANYRKRFRWKVIAASYRDRMDGLRRLPVSRLGNHAGVDDMLDAPAIEGA